MIIILVSIILASCSTTTRHKVLTFFFTGVPELGEVITNTDGTTIKRVKHSKKRRSIMAYNLPKFFVHGPFGARQCQLCHSSAKSGNFGNLAAKGKTKRKSKRRHVSRRLRLPVEKICLSCHDNLSQSAINTLGLETHQPVAKGYCIKCHDQHKAKRQFMLHRKDNVTLCGSCHPTKKLLKTKIHRDNPKLDCIKCHNPHMGKTALLLKSNFDEWDRYN